MTNINCECIRNTTSSLNAKMYYCVLTFFSLASDCLIKLRYSLNSDILNKFLVRRYDYKTTNIYQQKC